MNDELKSFFEGMDELMVQDPQLKKDLHDFADNAEDLEAVILQSELLVKKIIKRKPTERGDDVLSALSDLNINPSILKNLFVSINLRQNKSQFLVAFRCAAQCFCPPYFGTEVELSLMSLIYCKQQQNFVENIQNGINHVANIL